MTEPIRRVLGARPGGVERVAPLDALGRVEREVRPDPEAEDRPGPRREGRRRRPQRPPGDGHVDLEA